MSKTKLDKDWTRGQEGLMKRLYAKKPASELAKLIGKTTAAVRCKGRKMGLQRRIRAVINHRQVTVGKKFTWKKSDVDFIKKNWPTMLNREMAAILGISHTLVRKKCYDLGLYRMRLEYWTDEQVKFLKDNYKRMGDTEIAEIFRERWPKKKLWTKKHINKKRMYLRLHRTSRQLFNIKLRNLDLGYYEGMNWNNLIRRQVRIGTIVKKKFNGYWVKLIRVKGGYRKYAHVVWEENFGPIPKGKMMMMKDGNYANCSPENLECISREEAAARMRESDSFIAALMSMEKVHSVKGRKRINRNHFYELLKHPEILTAKRKQLQLQKLLKEAA